MLGKLEIDSLRTVRMIAQVGGVSRASEHLGLSQSAVSHKMRRLEETLDCRILTRRPGADLLTDAGKRLLSYAERILALHDEAVHSLSRRAVAGRVRLGITEDMSSSDLSRTLSRFSRVHPDVALHTSVQQSLVLERQLSDGHLDVAVLQVFEGDQNPTDRVLLKEGLHWVRSPDLQLDPKTPVPFLTFSEDCFYRRWAEAEAQIQGWALRVALDCASASGIASAVLSGMGVALLNERRITKDMQVVDGDLVQPRPILHVARARRGIDSAAAALLHELTVTETP